MTAERHTDPLRELAQRYGVALAYEAIGGETRHADNQDLRLALQAMGVEAHDAATCRRSLREAERARSRILDPVIVASYARGFPLRVEARLPAHESPEGWMYELALEGGLTLSERIADADFLHAHEGIAFDGRTYVLRYFQIEAPAPPGYHRLRIYREDSLQGEADPGECLLISHPDECFVAEPSEGVSLQLYALRSGDNCGSGEFADLGALGPWLKKRGYGVAAISPVHAGFPANPRHCSPYSPSSRNFVNPACIAPRRVPEWAAVSGEAAVAGVEANLTNDPNDGIEANGRSAEQPQQSSARHESDSKATTIAATVGAEVGEAGPFIDYVAAHTRRFALLERLFARFEREHLARDTQRAAEFRRFQQRRGTALERQALFDALYEHFATRHEPPLYGWRAWPPAYRRPDGGAAAAFARERSHRLLFYQYLYWLADRQCEELRSGLLADGVRLNLDLAVGADASGSETWMDREIYALEASAGAPPDDFAPEGQSWGLAPLIPHRLRERGYGPFIEILQANLPEDGFARIDHIAQLFRLYWSLPEGRGAYVHYPFAELLGILCLESRRRRCAIVGEDLGTVPENIRTELAARRILSWRLLYFEKDDAGFVPPEDYEDNSIATVNTHDLPTLRGYWNAADIRLRENLGSLSSMEAARAREEREDDKRRLLDALLQRELIGPEDRAGFEKRYSPQLRSAVHELLARSGSRVRLHSLHDLLDEAAQPNLPGTVHEYPNWSLSYSKSVEELLDEFS